MELAVVALVVAALAWAMLSFLGRYQGIVERDMVDMNIRNMRTGMRLQVSELLMEGRQRELPNLVGTNPVRWLGGNIAGYLGELDAPPQGVRGCWYFDRPRRMLVYRPQSSGFPGGAYMELRWQVVRSGGQDSGVKLVEMEVGQ